MSWLKDTIRTEEDIEQKLEARRLGTLWHERNRKKRTDIRIDDPLISFRYMESLQKLTQHVQKKMEERKVQTLLVTSVLEKEGRSTVAENLALALSMRKEKVFLLNADFRKQNASWLADEEGHLKIENFQKLLENLKKENDYVIIDTPPFLQNGGCVTSGCCRAPGTGERSECGTGSFKCTGREKSWLCLQQCTCGIFKTDGLLWLSVCISLRQIWRTL